RRKPMQARGGEYFSNYAAKTHGLRMTPINVEGLPGLWVDTEGDEGAGAPGYVVVLELAGGKVASIRDFRYARYAAEALLLNS
ncbi:MAG: RNA polymerase sigma factor, partial [Ramlibacter sp.]